MKQVTISPQAPGITDIAVPGVSDVLTPEEAAALFKVHPRQLQRWGVPCRVVGHKTTRYSRQEIYNWLMSRPATRPKRKRRRATKKGRR